MPTGVVVSQRSQDYRGIRLISPSNGATAQQTSVTLAGATAVWSRYEYCYDTATTAVAAAAGRAQGKLSTSVGRLTYGTTYYWQVREECGGQRMPTQVVAFHGAVRITGSLARLVRRMEPPTQQTSVTLGWGTSRLAASYEYCYDTSNDGSCIGSWTSAGQAPAQLSRAGNGTVLLAGAREECRWGNGCQHGAWWVHDAVRITRAFGKISPSNGASTTDERDSGLGLQQSGRVRILL
jgi:hypothetical protein